VTARVELVEVDRRRLVFRAEVSDDAGLVGEGTHERMIVPWTHFLARVEERRQLAGP
jgi:predicted thioesterase